MKIATFNINGILARTEALLAWRDDDAVKAVIIDHAEGRGFCAGGDIRLLADSAQIGGEAARAHLARVLAGRPRWIIADERPKLVKGIVAVEPAGPPALPSKFAGSGRDYGLTETPIAFDPPVKDPKTDLVHVIQDKPDAPGLVACALQKEPARKLPNLAGKPVLVVA